MKNNYDCSIVILYNKYNRSSTNIYIFPKKLDEFPPFSVIKIPLEKSRSSISAEWLITNHSTSREAPNKITFNLSADYQRVSWFDRVCYYTIRQVYYESLMFVCVLSINTVIKSTSSSNCFMSCRRLLTDLSDLYYITFLIKYRLNVYCRDSIYVLGVMVFFRFFSKL